jgi:hypothetical protein
MVKVIRQPGTDSYFVAVGRGRSFQPISGPHSNPRKAERQLSRIRSLTKDKRDR